MTSTTEQKIEINLSQVLLLAPWICLGLGLLLLLVDLGGKDYSYLIAACFFGILARIAQAEHHHRELTAKTPPLVSS